MFLGVRENSNKITQQNREKQSLQVLTPKLIPFLLLSGIIELVNIKTNTILSKPTINIQRKNEVASHFAK